jgi:Domain of unknown function (DUF4965)
MSLAAIQNIVRALNVRASDTGFWVLIGHQRLLIETANMLIMTYAYARASGDGSFISRYVR